MDPTLDGASGTIGDGGAGKEDMGGRRPNRFDLTTDEIRRHGPREGAGKVEGAIAFLRETLEATGPMPSNQLRDEALGAGVKFGTYQAARLRVGVKADKIGPEWWTFLPEHRERFLVLKSQATEAPR